MDKKIVNGPYSSLDVARAQLQTQKGSASNRQMLCEMSSGEPTYSPQYGHHDAHRVGGEIQGTGANGTYWGGWDDMKAMNAMCTKNAACTKSWYCPVMRKPG